MNIRDRLISEAGCIIEEKDRRDAQNAARLGLVLKAVLAAAAVFFLFSLKTGTVLPYVAGAATVASAVAYYGNRTIFSRRLRGFLVRDCDPEHFLSYYCALLASAGRQKKWESHIYNVIQGLIYAGKADRAENLLKLFETDCRSAEGDFRHDLAGAFLAYYSEDTDRLTQYVSHLGDESSRIRMNAELCDELDEAKQLPHFLELEKDGCWKELYDEVSRARFYEALPLGQLKKHAALAKAADRMGEEEKAAIHHRYVQEHGGTTFFRKRDL